jgi:hypothetical protein
MTAELEDTMVLGFVVVGYFRDVVQMRSIR